jgi:hypothetical protein
MLRNLLVFFLCLFPAHQVWGFENYKREAEVPEPMLFDLVRRINSDKGEFEMNVLTHGRSLRHGAHIAPEIEYAFADGKAIEFELPIENNRILSYKFAYQMKLPSLVPGLNGFQLIYEWIKPSRQHEVTPLYLLGHRWTKSISTMTMIGGRMVFDQPQQMQINPIINSTLFYSYNRKIDLGLEMNLQGLREDFEEFILLPQVHYLFRGDYKLQLGVGMIFNGYSSAFYALRFIKEFNH